MKSRLSRRRFLQLFGSTVAGSVVVACAPAIAPSGSGSAPAPVAAEPAGPAPISGPGGWTVNYPPFEKYSPTKRFTQPRAVGSNIKYVGDDTVEYHAGDRLTEEMLGVRFEPKFIYSGGGEYREKLNLAMASGDIPDFFSVFPFDLYGQMVESGLLKDITDLWEAHASDRMKEMANWGDGVLWEPIRINGRIYGFPAIKVVGQDEKLLWYRTDWFEQIGAQPPTTLDELHDVAKALVDAGVAGSDRNTIGLPFSSDLNTWICSTDPIFGGYGVMPGYWQQMDDGSVANYSTMEGTKEALALLNAWYKEGIIHQEFFTLDTNKSVEPVVNGQAGMYFGPYWCPRWPNTDAINNARAQGIENAGWAMATIPAGPAGRGTKFTLPVQSANCAGAHMSDEDVIAWIKAQAWVDELVHPSKMMETNWHGFEGYDYAASDDGCTLVPEIESVAIPTGGARLDVLVQAAEYEYVDALFEIYNSNPDELDCYERNLVEANLFGGEAQRYKDTRDAYRMALEAVENYAIGSAFNGIPTPTMISEQGNLNEMERAAFIDIIVGNQPISYFDEFVQQWKERGGDAIAGEIAEYLAAG
jgi:putative aldouronate transport system substrate-binding protein